MHSSFTKRQRSRRGFSFLEIMLVVVIIGILVSIVGPSMLGKTAKAKRSATKAQLKNIQTGLATYDMNIGALPTTEEGLDALVKRPSDVSEDEWEKCLQANEVPKDPWGEEYIYRSPGEDDNEYDLFSKGEDKKEDTEDDINLFAKSDDS